MVRTRFAPSPTGYLHVGGARTALFSWAYARQQGGKFILRIEDTDLERSTEESKKAILEGMTWLNLNWDEGPFYQMQRLARYAEVAEQLMKQDQAYRCYCSKEELEAMREAQRNRGEKPRYDGRCRNRKQPVPGVKPVVRFKNPLEGEVIFDDLVKGRIFFNNAELDDVVILRSDGVPTYNFGVVVDDLDMNITHVIRGDDHVNNTPRQINIFNALNASLPYFAHVPMILGSDGERLSKRHGAVSVMQYAEEGYLPEALLNYLARLGWSHGDAEVFSIEQFIQWFSLVHISKSAAQFNPEKLKWMNNEYIKKTDISRLTNLVSIQLNKRNRVTIQSSLPSPFIPLPEGEGNRNPSPSGRGAGVREESEQSRNMHVANQVDLEKVVNLFKDRSQTINEIAEECLLFYTDIAPAPELVAQHITPELKPVLKQLKEEFAKISDWRAEVLTPLIQDTVKKNNLKLPQIAIPLRVMVFGRAKTPEISTVLALAGKQVVLEKMQRYL